MRKETFSVQDKTICNNKAKGIISNKEFNIAIAAGQILEAPPV
jgi:hypothetical protein